MVTNLCLCLPEDGAYPDQVDTLNGFLPQELLETYVKDAAA